jgi:hypothetical protein
MSELSASLWTAQDSDTESDGALILLGDMPEIQSSDLKALRLLLGIGGQSVFRCATAAPRDDEDHRKACTEAPSSLACPIPVPTKPSWTDLPPMLRID